MGLRELTFGEGKETKSLVDISADKQKRYCNDYEKKMFIMIFYTYISNTLKYKVIISAQGSRMKK